MYRLTSSLRTVAGAAASAALLFGGGGASAEPRTVTVIAAPDTYTMRVAHADLDLASADGTRALSKRVTKAAHQVCNPGLYDDGLSSQEQIGCFAGAVSGARPQVAQLIKRASELAENGSSAIPAVALTVSAGK
jgi:UrcA family protein